MDYVLIVEDNDDLRTMCRDILLACGIESREATNGRTALDLLETTSDLPALILLDLMMPQMDGWEFLAHKNKSPRLAPIPVVVCSASHDFRRIEGIPVLRKPFDIDRLLDVISTHRRRS